MNTNQLRHLFAATLRLAALLWTIAVVEVFAQPAPFPCAANDAPCAHEAGAKHVVKKAEFWARALAQPVAQRIGVAPPELVEFLQLDVIAQAIPAKPHAPTLTPDFKADVAAAFNELPESVKALFQRRLAGIYFIEDIGGTGFTDMAFDASGQATVGFVVLDPSVLMMRTANEWATWKENTPFKSQKGFALRAEIESPVNDNRKNAIQYIILHELGHVLSIGANIHPSWNVLPKDVKDLDRYPFFMQSWVRSPDGQGFISRFDEFFSNRGEVVYYFGARLPGDRMVATYDTLEKTNFATLYGATRPGDDFAEAFASYVHTVVMKRPFAIRLFADNKEVKTFTGCWSLPHCAEKRAILARLLDGARAQDVVNSSYVAANGERVLRLDCIVPLSRREAWKWLATEEGLRKWMAPVVELDLRQGGQILTHYDKNRSPRDPGGIRLGVVNYLEEELMTLKVNLNASFEDKVRREDGNLQEILQLEDVGDGRTRLRASMLGWRSGPEWDKVYAFFEKGNTWTFQKLLANFTK